MKKWMSLLLVLLMMLPGLAAMEGTENRTVTVSLAENPTTGFLWSYAFSKDGVLREVKNEYKADERAGNLEGAGGTHVWTFEGVAEGDVTLSFVYAQPWDTETAPAQVVSYTYRVDAAGQAALLSTVDLGGNDVTIALAGNPTTGFDWSYTLSEDGILSEVSNQYAPDANPMELVGAGGIHTWIFEAVAPGDVTATFTYKQPWDTDAAAAETKAFTFHVDADKKVTLEGVKLPALDFLDASSHAQEPDQAATVTIPIKKLTLFAESKTVNVGQTLPTEIAFEPENASLKQVTYKSSNNKVATVDENGVVTGIKAGKVTITATAADGSKKKGSIPVQVTQPPTGIHFSKPDVRVGVNCYTTITAAMEPKNALKGEVTWISSDESIATVEGTSTRAKVFGHKWGRCTVTATTKEGSYTASIHVNVGSLLHAVVVDSIAIKDGKPFIVLKNQSDMNITQVRYEMTGFDIQGNPIQMSTKDNTLMGGYNHPLAPGEYTKHGQFTFYHAADYTGLAHLSFAITGWMTDTGYYNNSGVLKHDYNIAEKYYEWVECYNKLPQ